uniref:Uncharacterized protein n=1 Tax=Hyaloperonospora arabidopsidis (strain Emoy2) TaxID=559515 RepID=M4BXE1_HYAAE
MLPGTRGFGKDCEYGVDVKVTRLDYSMKTIYVWKMPYNPRHPKNAVEQPAKVDDLKLVATCKVVNWKGTTTDRCRCVRGLPSAYVTITVPGYLPAGGESLSRWCEQSCLSRLSPTMPGEGASNRRRAH